jgi:hypothetical protein
LEPVEDADALAGSLGKGKRTHTIEEMKTAARAGIARAGAAGFWRRPNSKVPKRVKDQN